MADVITRFKLETTQFDSKLRDAAKGLKEYTHQAELGGKSFTNFSQKSIEAARSLGTIASGANNAKDKVKDLVGAYNEAAKAYNNLSQQQQQSDFGKALAHSIGQLSDRLKEAKKELYDLGSAAESVKGKAGLFGEGGLTGMLQVAGGNLLAQGITTLGSEIAGTVQQSIELARQGEGIRMAFDRLNQPGLLNNLKEATHGTVSELELMKAAIKFDNFKLPLEDLGTYLAFAQQKAQDTGDSVDNMVTSIVNGLGRQSVQILDNLGISASEIRDRMKEGGDMTQVVAQIIREEMTKAGDYVETAATRAARAAAEATDKMEALGREAMPVAEELASVWNEIKTGGMEVLTFVLSPIADSIRSIRELLNQEYTLKIRADIPNLADGPVGGVFNNTPGSDHKVTAPGGYVVVTDKNGKQIGAKHFDSFDGGVVDTWKQTLTTKSGGRSGSKTDPTANIQKSLDKAMTNAMNGADKLKPSDVIEMPSVWEQYGKEIAKSMESVADPLKNLSLENWSGDAAVSEFLKNLSKEGKSIDKSFQGAASAISAVGSALSSIEDPGAKILALVMQGIAGVAQGAGMAIGKAAGETTSWYEYLAAAAAITAQMITTIASIHSVTGYQQGGEVRGNSYSGDQIPIMANAGEVVLTRAMQGNLASQLQGSGGMMNIHGVLQGENILLSVKRTLKRTGQGELLTWG